MKTRIILVILITCFHLSSAFMKVNEFFNSEFPKCYEENSHGMRRVSSNNINGQELPLPNSIETFVSLIERYEALREETNVRDLIQKLLKSFRIDNLYGNLQERKLRANTLIQYEEIKRSLCSVTNTGYQYQFTNEDFSEDEKCALHFMLSHTINDTRIDESAASFNDQKSKYPRETGVVSVHSSWNHAIALGRVLLGIYTALAQEEKEVDVNTILRSMRKDPVQQNVKINKVYAVTLGDLVTEILESGNKELLPNGMWNDLSCPTEYRLEDNNNALTSYSELRGAIDGLIIGKIIQEDRDTYSQYKLSQILRMYYGYYGLLDNEKSRWCIRAKHFAILKDKDMKSQMVNFNILYKGYIDGTPAEFIEDKTSEVLDVINADIFNNIDSPECRVFDQTSSERKYLSPTNVFVVMDSNLAKLNFQTEIIGNISRNFDFRPFGNLMGVYTNLKPQQQNMLDTVVKNTGIAGCPSCFAKYYSRTMNKEDDAEIWKDLNATLTKYEEEREEFENRFNEPKAASPGKVILYFKFGSFNYDWRLENAVHDFKWFFRGTTILAIGDNKAQLNNFIENEDKDIFTGNIPEQISKNLRERLSKVPGEFMYKACYQSTPAREADNKQEYYISYNKVQYWAMYPQYFEKSFNIMMKFTPEDGGHIRVCFARDQAALFENRNYVICKDTSVEEAVFYVSNPCYKRNILTCDPFYFSVEGKRQSNHECRSLRCNTPKDIKFEFSHEGISCNTASFLSVSFMALLFSAAFFYIQRQ